MEMARLVAINCEQTKATRVKQTSSVCTQTGHSPSDRTNRCMARVLSAAARVNTDWRLQCIPLIMMKDEFIQCLVICFSSDGHVLKQTLNVATDRSGKSGRDQLFPRKHLILF